MSSQVTEKAVGLNLKGVDQATTDMSTGLVDKIEHDAKAQVVHAREEAGKAEQTEHKSKAANPTAGVYGDVMLSAAGLPGLKGAAEMIKFVDERASEALPGSPSKKGASAAVASSSSPSRTIEDDIKRAGSRPGVYRDEPDLKVTSAAAASTAVGKAQKSSALAVKASPSKSEDIMAGSFLAGASLKEQPLGATKTWDVPEMKKSEGVGVVKKSWELKNASELALDSVQKVRNEHSAMLGHVQQKVPGMNLGLHSGPGINVKSLLSYTDTDGKSA